MFKASIFLRLSKKQAMDKVRKKVSSNTRPLPKTFRGEITSDSHDSQFTISQSLKTPRKNVERYTVEPKRTSYCYRNALVCLQSSQLTYCMVDIDLCCCAGNMELACRHGRYASTHWSVVPSRLHSPKSLQIKERVEVRMTRGVLYFQWLSLSSRFRL
jgi:hypothetical protein